MIPPSQQMQQAQAMQRGMQRPEDPLLQALSHQQMMGDMLKETASHKMKMLKMRMKYGGGVQQTGPPQGTGGL